MRLFPEAHRKPLDETLHACRELLEDMTFPTVRRWRETGGKVLGHFQVYFPEEIAHAAGMLPVKVRGGPVEPRQADSRFGSYLCSILKTSLELALSGRLPLDLFFAPPICDAARNLAAIWGRNVTYPSQVIYLPQNPNSTGAVEYLAAEYGRVRSEIERVAGRPASDDDLRRSIEVFNTNRRLIRQLYDLRRERPWLVRVDEAYALVAVGGLLPREEHNEILSHTLGAIGERPARLQDRIRVVFVGGFCEQPPLDLLRTIGDSCYVVDDDLLLGMRWLLHDVPVDGVPLERLARAYVDDSDCSPVQHDLRKPKEKHLLAAIRASGATAAIITAAKMCEPGLDEQVAWTKALEAEGIPFFVSEFEENMTTFEHLGMQLETFAENILFE